MGHQDIAMIIEACRRLDHMDDGLPRIPIGDLHKENTQHIMRMTGQVFLELSPLRRCQDLTQALLGKPSRWMPQLEALQQHHKDLVNLET